ncbi:hypothetical protein EI555_013769, partial [Monodon monoceros]
PGGTPPNRSSKNPQQLPRSLRSFQLRVRRRMSHRKNKITESESGGPRGPCPRSHHTAGFSRGTRTYLELRPAEWTRHISGLRPRCLRPFMPPPSPLSPGPLPPQQPRRSCGTGGGGATESLFKAGERVPESPRSGAVALGRQQWGPWSPGGRRGSGGGPVPGRGGVRGGAQGGQKRGGALGFQPGCEEEEEEEARRRGRGLGRGLGRGEAAPRSRPVLPAQLYSPGRRRRRRLLSLRRLPRAALPPRVDSAAPGRSRSLPGGGPHPPLLSAGAARPLWPIRGAPLSHSGSSAELAGAPKFASSPDDPVGREPTQPRSGPGAPARSAASWGWLWASGGGRRLLPRLPSPGAEEDPQSRSGSPALDDWHEERASHLVSDTPPPLRPRVAVAAAPTEPLWGQDPGAAVVGGWVESISGGVDLQALGGGQPGGRVRTTRSECAEVRSGSDPVGARVVGETAPLPNTFIRCAVEVFARSRRVSRLASSGAKSRGPGGRHFAVRSGRRREDVRWSRRRGVISPGSLPAALAQSDPDSPGFGGKRVHLLALSSHCTWMRLFRVGI